MVQGIGFNRLRDYWGAPVTGSTAVRDQGKGREPMNEVELRGGSDVAHPHDDLDQLLEEELRDEGFRAAYEDAMARSALLRTLVGRRGVQGISQKEVAARMGTTQSAVSDLERGATDPRLSTLQRYARAMGCQIHIVLRADRFGRGHWTPVAAPMRSHSVVSVSDTLAPYWRQLLTRVADQQDRVHECIASVNTRVAPVELEAPDSYTLAIAR